MDICKRINFLIDYVNFSPAEMRQNNQTFNWHTRLPELIVESRHIMSEKRQEFEEALRASTATDGSTLKCMLRMFVVTLQINRHKFIEELHGYAQQVEDLTVLSDVREMTQYLEKAQQLNKQLEACDEKV